MVVKWIKRWLKQPEQAHQLISIERDQHSVSRKGISHNALKVLYRLQNAGHEAYLVGGCVRDLQLGLNPKDFDVATDATPENIRKLFSNSRIIGRRFRIVHVTFGREIIEVTTFRGEADESDSDHKQSAEGLLLRDNVYGSLADDAKRRDFTINAMYYTAKDFSIKAYPQGMQDLQDKVIRIIGDAETRYREDPVRMLRAIRFAAKLGFNIEPATETPINTLAPLLTHIAPARLFDELLKLLMSGQGRDTWELMQKYDIVEPLLPQTHQVLNCVEDDHYATFIDIALRNTDARINSGKPVTPAFLYAALLWPAVRESAQHNIDMGTPEIPAWHKAMAQVLERQVKTIAIPKRFSIPMKEIWDMQLRLPKRRANRAEQIAGHPRFRAAYDFLILREDAGEQLNGLGQWWTDYQATNGEARQSMVANLQNNPPAQKRRRRRPPRKRQTPES
ncbi:polynucleotide adenylyltransferase PcnB [Reinekea sp. G2M2-21]|uniref:polynucleotide adenylyltransferase PcnB n=1 Tax=Reinekea sp. G2M2-21 TaxID=2788942 RepID=UPI0018AB86DB|nr:polynucleotide adenylyltransferase PcnB [Reinekea sp. G2M2-21]